MCILGYPRLISRENFRSPNFLLVADILHWFCHQLDSSHGIDATALDNETDRVKLITSTVNFLVALQSFWKSYPSNLDPSNLDPIKSIILVTQE